MTKPRPVSLPHFGGQLVASGQLRQVAGSFCSTSVRLAPGGSVSGIERSADGATMVAEAALGAFQATKCRVADGQGRPVPFEAPEGFSLDHPTGSLH